MKSDSDRRCLLPYVLHVECAGKSRGAEVIRHPYGKREGIAPSRVGISVEVNLKRHLVCVSFLHVPWQTANESMNGIRTFLVVAFELQ